MIMNLSRRSGCLTAKLRPAIPPKSWDAIPGDFQMKILNNVWCRTCSDTTGIGSVSGKVEKEMLILKGICTRCGNPVARVIENE